MGSRKPHRHVIEPHRLPVRLQIAAASTRDPDDRDRAREWLRRNLGDGEHYTVPGRFYGGEPVLYLHLPSVSDAAWFVMANPRVQLIRERWQGPTR